MPKPFRKPSSTPPEGAAGRSEYHPKYPRIEAGFIASPLFLLYSSIAGHAREKAGYSPDIDV
ncbi:hypothetical protein, partial [Endobacter medicaginis]|uniref:hypothetical protein n=1 Tax=Endobacter medicaginis TaxID=1181271 RepID=UPI001C8489CD